MFRFLVVAVLVAVASAAPRVRSSLPQLDGRIVGGENADFSEAPYQLSLQYYGRHICGASIISAGYAVTAAHCTDGSSASALSVRAGSSKHNSGGQVVNVAQINQHPSYDSRNIDYDISVLKLASSLSQGSAVGLPSLDQDVPAGTNVLVTGWGTLTEGGSIPTQLQKVTVPIISQSACRAAYGSSAITDRMICAGFTSGGKDACQGDSGGPLVAGNTLVGVVSWGYGCARPNYPGVYSSVPNLRKYITQVTGS